MIYVIRAFEKVAEPDPLFETTKIELNAPKSFQSLKQAKDFADEHIPTLKSGIHLVLEIEERRIKGESGPIKYRVERTPDGKVIATPLV